MSDGTVDEAGVLLIVELSCDELGTCDDCEGDGGSAVEEAADDGVSEEPEVSGFGGKIIISSLPPGVCSPFSPSLSLSTNSIYSSFTPIIILSPDEVPDDDADDELSLTVASVRVEFFLAYTDGTAAATYSSLPSMPIISTFMGQAR